MTANVNNETSLQEPIHQYLTLLLAQQQENSNPNPAYIQSIILNAISDPSVHVGFSELSALPVVQQTLQKSSTGKSILRTLDLFSYGSFLDYSCTNNDNAHNNSNDDGGGDDDEATSTSPYVKLNNAQVMKLKLLSVVTIVQQTLDSMNSGGGCSSTTSSNSGNKKSELVVVPSSSSSRKTRRNRHRRGGNAMEGTDHASSSSYTSLSNDEHKHCGLVQYSTLHNALGTTNDNNNGVRELENILIKCIYSNLLPTGTKLDQKNMCLVVKHALHGASSSKESDHVLCRDVNTTNITATPGSGTGSTDISDMISKLEMMHKRGENVKNYLKMSLSGLNKGIVEDVEKWKRVEESIKLAKETVNEKNVDGISGCGDDAMMMDMEGVGGGGHGIGRMFGFGKNQLKRHRGARRG